MSAVKDKHHLWYWMAIYLAVLIGICFIAEACSGRVRNTTPRAEAYPRIDRSYDTAYRVVSAPINLMLNKNAGISANGDGFQARYEAYGATLYCSVGNASNSDELDRLMAKRMERIMLDAGKNKLETYKYQSEPRKCSASVFYDLQGNSPTPIHFIATDSVSHVVAGVVVLDSIVNYDSIAPILDYLNYDVGRLVNSLNFNGKNIEK